MTREQRMLNRDWRMWGRLEKQLPPDDQDWRSWLILGGRGAGKTRAGAEWVRAQALGDWTEDNSHAERIAIIGPTLEQARAVMIEGKSGLLSIHMEGERPHYEPSKRLITWPNGAIAQVFSADEPESLRGPQFDAAWCDELAKWRLGEADVGQARHRHGRLYRRALAREGGGSRVRRRGAAAQAGLGPFMSGSACKA
jgi:phage terminase large subunit-like protein